MEDTAGRLVIWGLFSPFQVLGGLSNWWLLNDGEELWSVYILIPSVSHCGRRNCLEMWWKGVSNALLGYVYCWCKRWERCQHRCVPGPSLPWPAILQPTARGMGLCWYPRKAVPDSTDAQGTSWASPEAVLGPASSRSHQEQLYPILSYSIGQGCGIDDRCCLQHPGYLSNNLRKRGSLWLFHSTGLEGRIVSPGLVFLLPLSPLFWSSNHRNLNSISVKSWILKPDVQDH